ncbi:MAG: UbiA family prenyltransferase [Verrucomicrobiales bacterium]
MTPGFFRKWWTYQAERFPIFGHGPLVAAFSASALAYSAVLTKQWSIAPSAFAVAFGVCFLFFLQLRIADEFKDVEEDRKFRPYRAVPRGLVTLRELGLLFVFAAAIQFTLAWWRHPLLVIVLVVAWVYLALMSVEFFARDLLKARPITYMWTHMFIMPLVDLFATACQWMPTGAHPGLGLLWFLAASYANGLVIEIGRKIRRPEDEETGVETYSVLWGRRHALFAWWGCSLAVVIFATVAAISIGFALPIAAILGVAWIALVLLSLPMLDARIQGKRLELLAGLWTLVLYLSLGPLAWWLLHP